jgi:hypothetical protein
VSNSLYIHNIESRELRRGRWRIAREPLANRQPGSSHYPLLLKRLVLKPSRLSRKEKKIKNKTKIRSMSPLFNLTIVI